MCCAGAIIRLPSICTLALHAIAETMNIPALREGNKKTLTDWVRVHCGAYKTQTQPSTTANSQLLTPFAKNDGIRIF